MCSCFVPTSSPIRVRQYEEESMREHAIDREMGLVLIVGWLVAVAVTFA
jgi:hypothetical protein